MISEVGNELLMEVVQQQNIRCVCYIMVLSGPDGWLALLSQKLALPGGFGCADYTTAFDQVDTGLSCLVHSLLIGAQSKLWLCRAHYGICCTAAKVRSQTFIFSEVSNKLLVEVYQQLKTFAGVHEGCSPCCCRS